MQQGNLSSWAYISLMIALRCYVLIKKYSKLFLACANISQLQTLRRRHLTKPIHLYIPSYASISESYRRLKKLAVKLNQIIDLGPKPQTTCRYELLPNVQAVLR